MPSEFLHFPPAYTLVGLYRLLTDPSIRSPVLAKVKHASIRGAVVALLYAGLSWNALDWVIRSFLLGNKLTYSLFGLGKLLLRKAKDVIPEDSTAGMTRVGFGRFSMNIDLVFYTHMIILLPQISSILRFFIYKNLKLARSRAYALTVASRDKPDEFWSQGYIEEWAQPPVPKPGDIITAKGGSVRRDRESKWVGWLLWPPTQIALQHFLLIRLSPTLPLLSPLFKSTLRAINTGAYLHQPYFEVKRMDSASSWTWVEERKWAYRVFGFSASLLEGLPIIGLLLSISNRIGAAMWAFDMEKRQHLFSNGIVKPLNPNQVGFYGMGSINDLGVDIQGAEDEIDREFSRKKLAQGKHATVELRGEGIGSAEAGREKLL